MKSKKSTNPTKTNLTTSVPQLKSSRTNKTIRMTNTSTRKTNGLTMQPKNTNMSTRCRKLPAHRKPLLKPKLTPRTKTLCMLRRWASTLKSTQRTKLTKSMANTKNRLMKLERPRRLLMTERFCFRAKLARGYRGRLRNRLENFRASLRALAAAIPGRAFSGRFEAADGIAAAVADVPIAAETVAVIAVDAATVVDAGDSNGGPAAVAAAISSIAAAVLAMAIPVTGIRAVLS